MGDSLKASPDSIEGRGSSVECPEPTRGAHYHRSAGLRSGSIARSCAGTAGSETGAPPADAHVGGSVKMRRGAGVPDGEQICLAFWATPSHYTRWFPSRVAKRAAEHSFDSRTIPPDVCFTVRSYYETHPPNSPCTSLDYVWYLRPDHHRRLDI